MTFEAIVVPQQPYKSKAQLASGDSGVWQWVGLFGSPQFEAGYGKAGSEYNGITHALHTLQLIM